MARAYYNEIDPYAAQWLRNLIEAGHIAPGDVDTRSIEDVRPADLLGYTQCHFFAGIGIWSAALRAAGWPDSRPVWTGSCPCQPFSTAGKGDGFADERHLWPAWFHLVRVCRPAAVFGEQVANGDGLTWLDLVHRDLEGEGYTIGAADLCAAGFGAPHIRQRLYFVAHPHRDELRGGRGCAGDDREAGRAGEEARLRAGADLRDGGEALDMGDTESGRCRECGDAPPARSGRHADGADQSCALGNATSLGIWAGPRDPRPGELRGDEPSDAGRSGELVHTERAGLEGHHGNEPGRKRADQAGPVAQAGPTGGFWAGCDWIPCRHPSNPGEVEWRPVEPGTFPLVDGAAFRMGSGGPFEGRSRQGMLHGYGNGIVKPVAEGWIRVAMQYLP